VIKIIIDLFINKYYGDGNAITGYRLRFEIKLKVLSLVFFYSFGQNYFCVDKYRYSIIIL